MPGLDPGIHALLVAAPKTWMAGTSPAMTSVFLTLSAQIPKKPTLLNTPKDNPKESRDVPLCPGIHDQRRV
jgi:hypothetical protein